MERNRVFFSLVDQLRGLAAMLVVYSHLVGNFLDYRGRTWPVNDLVVHFVEQPLHMMQHFGWFGVTLFFFISGFVITNAADREMGGEFIVKRLLRIYPPLIFTVVIVGCLSLAGVLTVGLLARPTPAEAILSMSLINWFIPGQVTAMVVVGWTLAVEMIFYLAVFATKALLRRIPLLVPLVILALVLTTGYLGAARGGGFAAFGAYSSFVALLVLGQATYLARVRRIAIPAAMVLLGAGWLVFIIALQLSRSTFGAVGSSFLANSALAYLLFLVAVVLEGRIRPLRALSLIAKRTYSLYLMHVPIGFTVLLALNDGTHLPYTVNLLIALTATAAATEVCYRLIERPSIQLGKTISGRLRSRWPAAAVT